jgi:hypothetical protein
MLDSGENIEFLSCQLVSGGKKQPSICGISGSLISLLIVGLAWFSISALILVGSPSQLEFRILSFTTESLNGLDRFVDILIPHFLRGLPIFYSNLPVEDKTTMCLSYTNSFKK